jgi:hypothetical protein
LQSTLAPQTGRLDRHIRRSYLRVQEGVSRHRISYSLEEALRLAVLPGEEQGRIYCFRRVSLSGIPAEANRRVWMERVEHALIAHASQAVHASHPRASAANAIYFNNLEEALGTLLADALRGADGAAWTKPAWFPTSLLGLESGTSYDRQIPAILERLRPPAFAPGAAAAIVFAALGDADPAGLLSAIPTDSLREWLRAFDDEKASVGEASALPLPQKLRTALERAASHFGWKDPSTIWLALQATLCVSPSAWVAGSALKRARAMLRMLEAEQRHDASDRNASSIRDSHATALVFDDDDQLAMRTPPARDQSRMPSLQSERAAATESQVSSPAPEDGASLIDSSLAPGQSSSSRQLPDPSDNLEVFPRAVRREDRTEAHPQLLGSATAAAGLFFLLNALRRVGMPPALAAFPALAEARFATHILKRLAIDAGVADGDPILLCLQSSLEEFTLDSEVLAALHRQPEAWPIGFPPSSRSNLDEEYFLSVWTFAVRRWCWRAARLPVREIVERKGRVWQTRTDIDVTLPLAEADIRIRGVGLDIDPGWLPWFGVHGRVVRFHYRDRELGGDKC